MTEAEDHRPSMSEPRSRTLQRLAVGKKKGEKIKFDKEVEREIEKLYSTLQTKEEAVSLDNIRKILNQEGLCVNKDARLSEAFAMFQEQDVSNVPLSITEFRDLIMTNKELLIKALSRKLIIANFENFKERTTDIFDKIKEIKDGKIYPDFTKPDGIDPDLWAVSVCTIDGQRLDLGDAEECASPLGSCVKPILYGLLLDSLGINTVHAHVGMDISKADVDTVDVDRRGKPVNIMNNGGFIALSTLYEYSALPNLSVPAKHAYMIQLLRDVCGDGMVVFNNAVNVLLKESAIGGQIRGTAYVLEADRALPLGSDTEKALDFLFEAFSMETSISNVSVMAATLANNGVCPVTQKRIFSHEATKNVLSVLRMSGFANHSQQFCYKFSLPATSSRSGIIMLVVPYVMGVITYSPLMSEQIISRKGLAFIELFEEEFDMHPFSDTTSEVKRPVIIKKMPDTKCFKHGPLFKAAAEGDVKYLQKYMENGENLSIRDYLNRTAIHVASASGKMNSLVFLANNSKALIFTRDDWNWTPLDYARHLGNIEIVMYLENLMKIQTQYYWSSENNSEESLNLFD